MVRAKTIKKTDDASSKKKSEVREYSVTDTFEKGEMVFHKVWDDTGEVIEQVLLAGGKAEDGHQLRRWCDVEARLGDHAVAAQTCHHVAQGTVVHVEHPLPEDLPQGESVFAILVEIVVE